MLRPFVVDLERNLNEKEDLLGTMCYADQLVDTIKNVPTKQAYTIGLYGTWGSGKSTIIQTAKEKLEKDKSSRIKMVVYDAWKYSGDSFRRMFLLHLQNELELSTTPEMERFYTATTEEIKPNLEFRRRGAIYLGCVIVLTILALILAFVLKPTDAKVWVSIIFSILSLYAVMFGGNLFYELKVSQTKNILFAPEQFEECFRQMMEKVLKEKSWYRRLWRSTREYFKKEMIPEELDKLIIVIDNLDRCETGVVYSMLTDIKTFLGAEKYDVVFVIPVDHEALKKHLFARQEDKSLDAEEFLRKFFNVVVHIKQHRHDDILHYVNTLNQDQKLGFNPNTLSLIAKEYTDNPRHIVQMLNNLTVEQSLYDEEFAKKNETLIAVCIIIREHYPEIIDNLLYNCNKFGEDITYEFINSDFLPKNLQDNLDFKTTLRQAKYTLQNAAIKDIRKILTNTDKALSHLSDPIINALISYDYSAIAKLITDSPALQTDIFIEILRRIDAENTYDAEDAMILWAEFIAKLNAVHPLSADLLHMLDESLRRIYAFIPRDISCVTDICQLALNMDNAGYSSLKHTLFDFIKEQKNSEYKFYHEYVNGVIKFFTKIRDCHALREFAENYMYSAKDISIYNFTETQKQYLLTNTFVKHIIENISSIQDDKSQQLLVWSFTNLINLDSDVYSILFSKLTSLVGIRNQKPLAHFMNHITYALPIMKTISVTVDINPLTSFYKSIVDSRLISSGRSMSIINEANEEQAITIVDFCFEIFRISGEKVSINPQLQNIQKKCETFVKTLLMGMKQQGDILTPFQSNILSFESIDDEWYELIPSTFEKDANGNRKNSDALKTKIQLLYENRNDARALNILVKLTEDEEICSWFISLIDLQNYDILNSLPDALLPRIVQLYTPDNAEKFKDNNAMLKIVLQKGSRPLEDVVTQSLINRLNGNSDVAGAVDVIKSHTGWKRTNKNALKGLLQQKMPEDYDSNSKEAIKLTEIQEEIKSILKTW